MSEYYDEDPKRRKRRKRRYVDDAWGMAEYEDYADGNFADAEDYAAGLVDEEGHGGRIRSQYVGGADDDDYSSASYEITRGHPDRAVERATDLMQRMNRRTSYNQPPPTRSQSPAIHSRSSPPPNASPLDTLFDMRGASPAIIGIMVVIGGCAFSCLLLVIYLALG